LHGGDYTVQLNAALTSGLEVVKSPRMDIKEPCAFHARLFILDFSISASTAAAE
jgi:hypothetical protein